MDQNDLRSGIASIRLEAQELKEPNTGTIEPPTEPIQSDEMAEPESGHKSQPHLPTVESDSNASTKESFEGLAYKPEQRATRTKRVSRPPKTLNQSSDEVNNEPKGGDKSQNTPQDSKPDLAADTISSNDIERAQREEANSKCGFLKLSPEMRNHIYEATIPTTTRISIVSRVDKTQISLLQLCRAIRKETVPIFYGNTCFTFDLRTRPNFQRAKSWLDGLSPEAVASLRKIYVQSDIKCCCKEVGKNERPHSLHAWVDVEAGKWSQWGYHGCRICSSQEEAKELLRKIQRGCAKQNVRREDLAELMEILRPIRAFDFSFEVAKDGGGKATFETRSRQFGYPGGKTGGLSETELVLRGREIKQPRSRYRGGGSRPSDHAPSSSDNDTAKAEAHEKKSDG